MRKPSGRHALKARMPRFTRDHRERPARRIRGAYDELGARYHLTDGVARRVALMTATASVQWEDLTAEVVAVAEARRMPAKDRALTVSRLRRRQAKAAGQYLAGLRTLEGLTAGNGHRPLSPQALLAELRRGQ